MNSEMDLFKNRVQYAITKVGTATDLARKVGITRQAISSWAAGDTDPTRERLILVADASDIYLEWLATGRGPRDKEAGSPPVVFEPQANYRQEDKTENKDLFGKSVNYLREIFDSEDQIFISAILANLHSFSRAIRREGEVAALNLKNKELTVKIEGLEKRLAVLEDKLSAGTQGEEGDPPRLATGTEGM